MTPRTYDYVIVGAGSAGCAMARRLAVQPELRILLLEQGAPNTSWKVRIPLALGENYKPDARYMRHYLTVPQTHMNGRVVEHPRGIGLGGSSLVNGMVFLRGNPHDYDRWVREGARGWSYAEVLPYFKRMERRAEGADSYRGDGGPIGVRRVADLGPLYKAFLDAGREAGYPFTDDVNGYRQEGFCRFDMNVDAGYRASSAFGFLEKAGRPANLEIQTGAMGFRLLFRGLRVVGVEYLHRGEPREARVDREVILCAGAIGSPQILLLSGVGPADELKQLGITPVHDLPGVGKNLHDHLELDLQWECTQPVSMNGLMKPHLRAKIGLEWLLFKRGVAAVNGCHAGAFLRSAPEIAHPNIQFHFCPVCFDGWVPRKDEHGFRLCAGPMRQTSRGALTLRSRNPLDVPFIDPNYLATETDRQELRASYAAMIEVVSQRAFDPYRGKPLDLKELPNTVAEIDQLVRETAETAFHLCGTCKMGSDLDDMAVVDPQTRVRGLGGLRVADASIMPSIVSSNLNAPVMMIGERASDLVLGKSLAPDDAPYHRPSGPIRSGGAAMACAVNIRSGDA
jgi:choline dehydrogenase